MYLKLLLRHDFFCETEKSLNVQFPSLTINFPHFMGLTGS